ncbi:hypothetical protein [Streptomyces badius]|uniref:DUF1963 domain-containing protein n=1 Tax=Streptomyces badius TaxID=1941 RepID=A0ABQ2TTL6_STRBA|nr:hypothetical protein [Streptomyces badius]GGS82961.1 hypothetical protein GCM10010253_66920 [Streptomyces badius]
MTRSTPPRPVHIEGLFPKLGAFRGVTTRLHPRPGQADASVSSVGGPLLWPADEPWPVCAEPHKRSRGHRIPDIRRKRQVLADAWARDVPTEDERVLITELGRRHRDQDIADTDPIPLTGLVQLYRRDVPGLAPGPDGCDLLQVLWCPFEAHGPSRHSLAPHVRWRRSDQVRVPLDASPQPTLVGFEGSVAEPCVLHPEQVVTYPYAGSLPARLEKKIAAWEEKEERKAEKRGPDDELVTYHHDLSIPQGCRVGGFPSWHTTDPHPMNCVTCAAPMLLLLTIDSNEWDGASGSWMPIEERAVPEHLRDRRPTKLDVGRDGLLNILACPTEPGHPHRWSLQ